MVRGWDGEGMLGNSLRRAEDPGLSPTPNHSPGTQLVGGSSWDVNGGYDGDDNNNKLWSFSIALLKCPSRSEFRCGTRRDPCP